MATKYGIGWTALVASLVGIDAIGMAAGAPAGPTDLLSSVVCLSAPTLLILVLTPTKEISDALSNQIRRLDTTNSDQ